MHVKMTPHTFFLVRCFTVSLISIGPYKSIDTDRKLEQSSLLNQVVVPLTAVSILCQCVYMYNSLFDFLSKFSCSDHPKLLSGLCYSLCDATVVFVVYVLDPDMS